jgi:hypothetical protein
MTDRADNGEELTLADVEREFPSYQCVSGLYCARPSDTGTGEPAPVKADDPPGLRGEIIQHQARRPDAVIVESITLLFGPSVTGTPSQRSDGQRPAARPAC